MNNQLQNDFLEKCHAALVDGTFKRVVFGSRGKASKKRKAKFELVVGGKKLFIDYSNNWSTDKTRSELDPDQLILKMKENDISPFGSAVLSTENFDFHYTENRKLEPRLYKAKASMKGSSQNHNRSKNYVLNSNRPYLKSLGVTNAKDDVVKKHYGKFRQIANFVEIIDRDIRQFVESTDEPIRLLDLGCGKGYLTFATYDYVRSRSRLEPEARGIDIKPNVINLCNSIANELGFNGLKFENSRIQPDQPLETDILIALHACDTATDDALALGVRSNMKYFFCAPCCQAEIAAQLESVESDYDLVTQFPLMRRRQADILTDVCRAHLLRALGYSVKFLEFTALEHTSKNVMLAGRLDEGVDRKQAFKDYLAIKKSAGFKQHALEQQLTDLLDPQR